MFLGLDDCWKIKKIIKKMSKDNDFFKKKAKSINRTEKDPNPELDKRKK